MGRNFKQLIVPTTIEHLEIQPGAEVISAKAACPHGDLEAGAVECVADGRLVLRLSACS